MSSKIKPYMIEGVPHCWHDCLQYTRRLRKDGVPSRTRAWFCAIDGHDYRGHVCEPAVERMHTELVQLRGQQKGLPNG